MNRKKIVVTSIGVATVLIALLFIPTNAFLGINSYNPGTPSPMEILQNTDDEILMGFEITPVQCVTTENGLTESHFKIENTHEKDYEITMGVSFTDNNFILYEKQVRVQILADEIVDQIHRSDDIYENPVCVVQINDWSEI